MTIELFFGDAIALGLILARGDHVGTLLQMIGWQVQYLWADLACIAGAIWVRWRVVR